MAHRDEAGSLKEQVARILVEEIAPALHLDGSALEVIEDVLADFPFDSDSSRAHALALMLTPIIRPVLGGSPAPMAISGSC